MNVVNVILVDFRGFDTLGEITVLCLAGLGVFGLRRVWVGKRDSPVATSNLKMKPLPPSSMLQIVSKATFPLILIFSLYMVFRGHNQPGGGFIGGLIIAGGLILELLAVGRSRFLKKFPLNSRLIFSIGLSLAFLTGLGSTLFGYPFLTSTYSKALHLSTASLFDLGVYLVVVGVAMEVIVLLGEPERV